MQILRTDRGGEYLSAEFTNYCHEHGIKRELTQASTPQQNGISERRNKTLIERARSLSHECNLSTFLWTEAVATANYLVNRSPTKANGGMTSKEKYSCTKPSVSHLNFFDLWHICMFPKKIVRSWIVKLNHVYSLGMTIRVKSIDYLILSEEKSYLVRMLCSTKIELDFTISKETMAFMRILFQ
jgi:hypothetical protein